MAIAGVGGAIPKLIEDEHILFALTEWNQRGRQLEIAARTLRRPLGHVRPIGHVKNRHAHRGLGGRGSRQRFEVRQRQRGSESTKKGAACEFSGHGFPAVTVAGDSRY
jgi:hypothetical protein